MQRVGIIGVAGPGKWLSGGAANAVLYHTQWGQSDWRWIAVYLLLGAAFAAQPAACAAVGDAGRKRPWPS